MSRQAMFPTFDTPNVDQGKLEKDRSLPPLISPESVVVHKAMGNFARREVYTPQTNSVRPTTNWSLMNLQHSPVSNAV